MIAKRLFDIFLSAIGLLVLMPLFVVIALWIKIDSTGPVFFRQERVGRYEKIFRIHKFRTMTTQAAMSGPPLTVGNDVRTTLCGRFLRQHKLDELPQLIDVLRGDMSLVGPRPEVPRYVAHYSAEEKATVLSVRPGITDFAAIAFRDENVLLGRSDNPERDYLEKILPVKLTHYRKYVNERTFRLDLWLIFATIRRLLASANDI